MLGVSGGECGGQQCEKCKVSIKIIKETALKGV